MNLQNHFLVAMPSLQDPLFKQSVVYICEHNKYGAMGIVINKPVEKFTIENILNNLKITSTNRDPSITLDKPVFFGGPLADDRGFILHTPCKGFGSSVEISPQMMITTSKDVLETLGTTAQPKNILIALGYSGWIKGQLEQELIENTWLTVPATKEVLFNTPVAARWHEAAKILGIDMRNIINKAGHA
ncbi:YqgE/AlgH family protein [Blochmannia endosymbiont of Colobopsis nipponica]|uniref:YqgE/AlgH family protein n=1 Tax=Blochmannia endosymbiont of Colobopsis nipponica TaxID=2681987 RepID=UPI0017853B04|nr:YqgE/AlgH family protein [Blochmannia endosymbiont of Colobopsis nipponica]QOI11177.1 YqgE/AlgH family protein [Blochmannia endosymbiont of Colobopsis nipponica]